MKRHFGHLIWIFFLIGLPGKPGSGQESTVRFVDVARKTGLNIVTHCGGLEKKHLIESDGTGGAFLDYDGDGFLDIYIVNAWMLKNGAPEMKGANALYRNRGDGTFEDVTELSGVGDRGWGGGVCVADYNNDGAPDLYVTNFGPNLLYRNNGDGTFAEVAQDAGVQGNAWSGNAAFLDFDTDGDVDLYVANYVTCTMEDIRNAEKSLLWRGTVKVATGPMGMNGAADIFYRNNGDGTFTDITEETGLTDAALSYGYGVCAADADGDSRPDLYVANDSNPNFYYRNNGDGTFTDMALWTGLALSRAGKSQAGMGVGAGDYDNDGDTDLFVTNFAFDYSTLYKNIEGAYFEDVSEWSGLVQPTYRPLSWGTGFLDYDNDGDLDLFVANGHLYPAVDAHPDLNESYGQTNQIFRNDAGHFVDVSGISGDGMRVRKSSRGAAFGDYDNDGDLDLLIMNVDETPTLLQNQAGNQNHWLQIQLVGTTANRSAVGARVTAVAGTLKQIREVKAGSSYRSQNDLRVHFGLGNRIRVDRLEVRWSRKKSEVFEDIPADRFFTIEEGKGIVAVKLPNRK